MGRIGGTALARVDRDEAIALRVEAELAAMERLARRMGLASCRPGRDRPPAWWPGRGSGGDGGGGMDGFEDVD